MPLMGCSCGVVAPGECLACFGFGGKARDKGDCMNQVRVGTGVIIVRRQKTEWTSPKYSFTEPGLVLTGMRKGAHAAGLVSFPGGHLDFGETWEQCALREVREECGDKLKIKLRLNSHGRLDWFVTNDIMPEYDKHYITIFMVADWIEGEPENTEPNKCEGWKWITFDELAALARDQKTAQWIPLDLMTLNRSEMEI